MDDLKVDAYQRLHELTLKACQSCAHSKPYSCCEPDACEQAAFDAYEIAGILLVGPFLGDNGCMLPPHLRPRCTRYTCAVQWKAERPSWINQYNDLVNEIDHGCK